jgi:hypothetical protein
MLCYARYPSPKSKEAYVQRVVYDDDGHEKVILVRTEKKVYSTGQLVS